MTVRGIVNLHIGLDSQQISSFKELEAKGLTEETFQCILSEFIYNSEYYKRNSVVMGTYHNFKYLLKFAKKMCSDRNDRKGKGPVWHIHTPKFLKESSDQQEDKWFRSHQ